jgi:hypothetical protein
MRTIFTQGQDDMELPSGMFAAALLLAGIEASQVAVRIANDRGGLLTWTAMRS